MIIKNFIKGLLHNNNYVLIDEITKEAILIDCTKSDDDIMEYIISQNAKLKYILLTHGHYDHIMGLTYYKNKYDIDFWIHKDDAILIENLKSFTRLKDPITDTPKINNTFDETKIFNLGNKEIKVIHTPGHSKGSVCFLIDNFLFSGDTMFYETHGRTDLYGGNYNEILQSLKTLLKLPKNTIVYPGHGEATTIEHELITYKNLL